MAVARARDIMIKLFLADRTSRDTAPGAGGPFSDFFDRLTAQEASHPLATWIARKRDALDWDENVCDMVSRYFRIPRKPLWPNEVDNGYEAAAEQLERRLRTADRLGPRTRA